MPIVPADFEPARYTILVVDDNPTNLGVLTDYLKDYSFTILNARDGEMGLKRATYAKPDIILLDVMMPGLDGFEICRRLKAQPETRDIPVIFMTALADTEDKLTGFEIGAVDYVTKPVQQAEVLARLVTHLRMRDLTRIMQEKNRQLEAVAALGRRLIAILELEVLLSSVVELLQASFGYYYVSLWLTENEALRWGAGCGSDLDGSMALATRVPLTAAGPLTEAVRSRVLQWQPTLTPADRAVWAQALPSAHAELAAPLVVGPDLIGVLDVLSATPAELNPEQRAMLGALANQVAVAVRNAQQYAREKELHHLEAQRAAALAELNASKDRFFSIVAHDLKSPFGPLLGLTKLLGRTAAKTPPAEIQQMAHSIYNSARTIYALLENLLAWASAESGRMKYEPERLDLQQLADQSCQLLLENANQKSITLAHTVPAATYVLADEQMVSAILRNLLSNALKFTPPQGRVTLTAQPGPMGFIACAVQDTGVGIKAENLVRLFQLGTPLSTPGTAEEKGTGLGLMICKEMVEKHGGRLWLESVEGQGTTVHFTLPAVVQPIL